MKVCIVTVYNSINSGSYWQAYAMGEWLRENGYDVLYYERKTSGSSCSPLFQVKRNIKHILKRNISAAKKQIECFIEFKKSQKIFTTVNKATEGFDKINCFVIGSDTLWNLDDKYFADNRAIYFGDQFKDKKVITYAVSAANTELSIFRKYDDIPRMINNLSYISVRDKYTKDIVSCFSDTQIYEVCDPTMLLKRQHYEQLIPYKKTERFIFLYLFKRLSDKQSKELRKFADENRYKIISGIREYEMVDKVITNTPNLFMEHMLYAEYIITDTFHGTVFSINLNKQFVAINRGKNKVNDLLYSLGFEDRLTEENESISKLYNVFVDYEMRRDKIEKLRDSSCRFLSEALKK